MILYQKLNKAYVQNGLQFATPKLELTQSTTGLMLLPYEFSTGRGRSDDFIASIFR